MRNWKFAGLIFSILAVMSISAVVSARITGTNPTGSSADAWCTGKSGAESCVDYLGDVIPTTTNASTLGTSALQWNQAYTKTLTVGTGGVTNSGGSTVGTAGATDLTNTGGTAATQFVNSGITAYAAYNVFNLAASSVVPVNASLELVGANGATVTLTSTPEISTSVTNGSATLLPFGTFLVIASTATGQNVVFTSSTSTNASGLVLGAATRTINKNKTLLLWLDNVTVPAVWREIAFGNN